MCNFGTYLHFCREIGENIDASLISVHYMTLEPGDS